MMRCPTPTNRSCGYSVASKPPISQVGFTLVEILVAMTIGLILISGMVTVFSGYRISANLNSALTEIQENARFAVDSITRDARMAGFQGCIDLNQASVQILSTTAPTTNLFATAVTGSIIESATSWSPAAPTNFVIPDGTSITPIVDSHTLSLQFGNQQTLQISPMSSATDDIVLTSTDINLDVNDLAIISNCQSGDLFTITAINKGTIKHASTLNSKNSLSTAYGQSGERNMPRVMKFEANVYFIADSGRTNETNDPIISLYRQTLPFSSDPMEMIEGVEHLRIKFGLREEGTDNMSWVSADDVGADFGLVEAIQIGMLLTSRDQTAEIDDSKHYRVAGDLIIPEAPGTGTALTHAGDRRLRQAFNTTISVRNRR